MYDTVIIEVRGGVAAVVVVPRNVQVLIRDYDGDGEGPYEYYTDSEGNQYTESST